MKYTHTFAICAYKKSQYLESCIKSLKAQTVKSNIIICTSTPCAYIEKIAQKYDLPYYVREGESDIQDDWNFACQCANTDLITIAHQDDQYNPSYLAQIMRHIQQYPDVTLAFTDYRPLKHYRVSYDVNCFARRLLRMPIFSSKFSNQKALKKASLIFGNTICCSSVTYNMRQIQKPVFTSEFKFSLDWDTFYKFAGMEGRFIYVDKPLVYFRIHSGATTNLFIINKGRYDEDVAMFEKLWPQTIARLIMKIYLLAYKTYDKC
ncbi:MAG: glycosyltransferase [Lachnospiraceae bacterium]|nr:glycosyltransferase [Lachnospiraceae bacterium]